MLERFFPDDYVESAYKIDYEALYKQGIRGLIYDIDISAENVVIKMTFTSPTCPMMEELLAQVHDVVANVAGNVPVRVDLVWDPPWDLSRMSDAARLELDLTNQGW